LVEDNEMNRDMLSRRLARRGFEVVFAVDGKQAVDAAWREKPDIILTDMSLPVMEGWEATRRVKSDDATRGVPVIGLTARAMSGDREKATATALKPRTRYRMSSEIAARLPDKLDGPSRKCVAGRRVSPFNCKGISSSAVYQR
jgi:two-component system, cell cycle response regulator DivK